MDEFQNNMEGVDQPIEPQPDADAELARSSTLRNIPRPRIALSDSPRSEQEGWLTVDVYQTPSEIVIESAVAGVNPDELDILATPDSVSIKGERRREKEVHQDEYLHQECYWGRFARSIILPQEVDPENADVHFRNGILTIHLPKAVKLKSKRLKARKID